MEVTFVPVGSTFLLGAHRTNSLLTELSALSSPELLTSAKQAQSIDFNVFKTRSDFDLYRDEAKL